MVTPADLDRIEALARAAAPGPYGVETFAIVNPKEGSVVMPGPRWLVESTATDVRPLRIAEARYFAALDPTTVLALVEAARRVMRPPDPREIGSSRAFRELLDDLRCSVAWGTVTDEADRLLAHEAVLRARADGVPYPPSCPSCGHSPHREDPDGKCWYGGVGGCACARASD